MELQQLSPNPLESPHPLSLLPQQQHSRRRIMIQLHPPSLLLLHPHPQSVAAKSLIKTSVLSFDMTGIIYILKLCGDAWTVSKK